MLSPNIDISKFVRPTISILFTVAVIGGFFMGKVSGEVLTGMLGPIIGFWFGERSALKTPGQ